MTDKQFPLVADDEIMLTEMPHMNLYDELDLISNIIGDYTDRNYLEWVPIVDSSKHAPAATNLTVKGPVKKQANFQDFKRPIDKSDPAIRYAEQAREEARADLKKKRSAPYLTSEIPNKIRNRKVSAVAHSTTEQPKPTAPFQKNAAGEFAKFGNKLKQESYILAEIKPDYRPKTQKFKEKPKKNTYDFLKNSQVYKQSNPQEEHKKHRMAQELNLTKLDKE